MISIIIPTYNNTDGFKECLNSIIKYTDTDNAELIVIANGSDKLVIQHTMSVVHNFKQHKKLALKHHVSALVLCLSVIKKIPCFKREKSTIVEKFNCFLSLWAIAASIPDTLPL